MDSFYVTLPSNASMDIYPDNAISHYTTRLRQPLTLDGGWEVAIVEASVPTRWTNVTEGECRIRVKLKRKSGVILVTADKDEIAQEFVYKNFVKSLHNDFYERAYELARALNRAWRELRESVTPPFGRYGEFNPHIKRVFMYDSDEKVIKLNPKAMKNTPIEVSGKLGLMLGLGDGTREWIEVPSEPMIPAPTNIDHIYVYTNIVEFDIVGDTVAPLLRIIPMQSFLGNNEMTHYTHVFNTPHYLTVSNHYIESIQIDLRNDLGQYIPFVSGRTIVKLHFRRRK